MQKKSIIFLIICGLAVLSTLACDHPINGGPPTAQVPADPWQADIKPDHTGAKVYESCASCHMADAMGRKDGQVPRLAGQSTKVLIHKLEKLRAGSVTLPVMLPFARALSAQEVTLVSNYIATIGQVSKAISAVDNPDYGAYCAACHGPSGMGNDTLLAPRLCGQHQPYLLRRMQEIKGNSRGDADPGMRGILSVIAPKALTQIANDLAQHNCQTAPE